MNYPALHADSYYNITGKMSHLEDSCYQAQLASKGITYLLTPWSRVLLEKLTGSEASQEIPCTL